MNWLARLLFPAKARAYDAACRAHDEITQAYESWRRRNRHEIPPDEDVYARHPWLRPQTPNA